MRSFILSGTGSGSPMAVHAPRPLQVRTESSARLAVLERQVRGVSLKEVMRTTHAALFNEFRVCLVSAIVDALGTPAALKLEQDALWKLVYHNRISSARKAVQKAATLLSAEERARSVVVKTKRALLALVSEARSVYERLLEQAALWLGAKNFTSPSHFSLDGLVHPTQLSPAPLPAVIRPELPAEFNRLPTDSPTRAFVARLYIALGDLERYALLCAVDGEGAAGPARGILTARLCYFHGTAACPELGFASNQASLTFLSVSSDCVLCSSALLGRALVAHTRTNAAIDNFGRLVLQSQRRCSEIDRLFAAHLSGGDSTDQLVEKPLDALSFRGIRRVAIECGVDARNEFGVRLCALVGGAWGNTVQPGFERQCRFMSSAMSACLRRFWPADHSLAPLSLASAQMVCFLCTYVLKRAHSCTPSLSWRARALFFAIFHELTGALVRGSPAKLLENWGFHSIAPSLSLLVAFALANPRVLAEDERGDAYEDTHSRPFADALEEVRHQGKAHTFLLDPRKKAACAEGAGLVRFYSDCARLLIFAQKDGKDFPAHAPNSVQGAVGEALDCIGQAVALPEDTVTAGTAVTLATGRRAVPRSLVSVLGIGCAVVRRCRVVSSTVRLIAATGRAMRIRGISVARPWLPCGNEVLSSELSAAVTELTPAPAPVSSPFLLNSANHCAAAPVTSSRAAGGGAILPR
eukprot:gnl/Chilomastix_cuspidata/5534.p1 GENE.gnl/Chilomastix_cuspidata/5534~~gnl/Chilomastix_cuspidata/5534.p1  ORF type:complete len:696 (-),score=124.66 gnl/Chilomastix_cuspidata/5534:1004-3091(-)